MGPSDPDSEEDTMVNCVKGYANVLWAQVTPGVLFESKTMIIGLVRKDRFEPCEGSV